MSKDEMNLPEGLKMSLISSKEASTTAAYGERIHVCKDKDMS
jgi:hypothetical protein